MSGMRYVLILYNHHVVAKNISSVPLQLIWIVYPILKSFFKHSEDLLQYNYSKTLFYLSYGKINRIKYGLFLLRNMIKLWNIFWFILHSKNCQCHWYTFKIIKTKLQGTCNFSVDHLLLEDKKNKQWKIDLISTWTLCLKVLVTKSFVKQKIKHTQYETFRKCTQLEISNNNFTWTSDCQEKCKENQK